MKSSLKTHEIVNDESLADTIIINSCTVTNGADSDVRNYINRVNRLGKKVLFTGCGVKYSGEDYLKNNKVFGVFSMSKKNDINSFLAKSDKFIEIEENSHADKGIVNDFQTYSKAFVKIQEGCNFRCSYCIIPAVRGRSRSIDEAEILNEASNLVANGLDEIILTGTNMGSYGKDTSSSLARLLSKLGDIKGIKRVRLGSLEPSQITDEFLEIVQEPFVEKHLHIALQHTNDEMLKIMRRRNRVKNDLNLFEKLAEFGFSLGTDFIVGHPGETDEIWAEAVENFRLYPLTHLHAFVYSPRSGTYSATMKQSVNGTVAKNRLKMIKNIVSLNNFNFRKAHQIPLNILIEQSKDGYLQGFDQFYNKCFIKDDNILDKKWIKVDNYDVKFEGNFA
ncbi:MAG: tRNA (N(6)-L-threonylcarbamoyladenosine(37)-C(2))-methylthiotransferase MtaB [Campylobacter sp.]|nr:tRNA (N(6)-L-threonylcarbamoyladenosine(37)-C(2))-methylthiotransferase MtaB [Campylobacter sp.]